MMTVAAANIGRRGFLQAAAASGLVLGFHVSGYSPITQAAAAGPAQLVPNVYVAIDRKGTVTVTVPRVEMGTGIRTSLAMILADELDADWHRIQVVQAQGDVKYGDQNTDGSRSVRQFFTVMRQAGATARHMLIAAASAQWKVGAETCHTENGEVIHAGSGRRRSYGDLVTAAATQAIPAKETLQLKSPDQWRYIGQPMPIVDLDDIVHGHAVYGIDMTRPGMKYASTERPPVYGATLKSYDAKDALAMPGIVKIVEIPSSPMPSGFSPLGGIAVIANDTWSANQARQKLKIDWDLGPNASYDTTVYRAELEATAKKPGKIVRDNGQIDQALQGAAKRISADYFVPHLAHAMMEPESATAHFRNGQCDVWVATQNPQQARKTVAEALGIDQAQVTINVTLLGGGFGRKSKPDFAGEAAFLSREAGVPIKVTWTREDDLQHDYYHAICAQHMEGGLDQNGRPTAWLHRTVFPSILSTFTKNVTYGAPGELGQGVIDMPYAIENVRCENGPATGHVRIGWYRSVYNIPHGFAVGSFADELAVAAGKDPVEFLLSMLGPDRKIDPKAIKIDYANYGASIDEYPIDTARYRQVIELAAKQADWGKSLPPRQGQGIAVHRSFLTYVAAVAQVAVDNSGNVAVQRVDLAVDCGRVINPDRVRAQFEGATIMSISNALYSGLSFKNGQVEQTNFGDYQVARIDATPETHVHIVPSDAPPGGVGEPGVPPIAAAICNAIFRATGNRMRTLPVESGLLKSA